MREPDSPLIATASAPEVAPVTAPIFKRRWTIVGLLFTASLINYFDRATLSMALPSISKELGLGPATKGILLSAFFWSYALMQIPVGWLADRCNLRWLYAGAFLVWSVAQGLTGFATGLGTLLVYRVLLGLGESIYLPGGTKVVSILFPPAERGLPCGLFDCGTRSGLVLEGLIVPWSLVFFGWRTTFAAAGFVALIWLLPWFLVTPRQLRGVKLPSNPGFGPTWRAVGRLCSNRNLLGICMGFFCFDYYWYLLVTWLPDYLVTVRHLSIPKAGFYASLPFFVFGISQPIGGWIADTLIARGWSETKTRKGIVAAAFSTGLLLIPAARVTSANHALLLIVGACLVGLSTANLLVILQCCAPPDEVGLWTGIENFIGNVAGICAPLATGFLIRETGSYSPAFYLGAIMLFMGLFAYMFVVGELRPPALVSQRLGP